MNRFARLVHSSMLEVPVVLIAGRERDEWALVPYCLTLRMLYYVEA